MVYFTIMFDFTWSVSDCEEFVGVDQGAKYETLWQENPQITSKIVPSC